MKKAIKALPILAVALCFLLSTALMGPVQAGETYFPGTVRTDQLRSSTKTVSDSGPTDNVDVSGVNVLFTDTSSNNVTIGGLTGGKEGQGLVIINTHTDGYNTTLEDTENATYQQMYLSSGSDETLTNSTGGWELMCNGTDWVEVAQ